MPVASSSRRNRRAPSSEIEEDGPSQARQPQEDVEMDDEGEHQTRRSKKSSKKKRGKEQDSDGEDVAVDQEDIPVPELKDYPLDKNQMTRLHGVSSDWALMRDKVHLHGYGFIREVASSVAEFTEGEKGEKALTEIDLLMRDLLDTEHELTAHEKALDDLQQKVARGEEIEGVIDAYQQGVQKRLDEYKTKTARQKYAKNDYYQKFKQAIYEVQHPDVAMPPLADLIPQEEGDDSDDEDDIQMGGVTQDYRCPLTLQILVDPVTSKTCGHSYSAEAIRDYLAGSRLPKSCPATGCNKEITLSNLSANKDLAKRAKEAARRERAREEDSEGEEVIE